MKMRRLLMLLWLPAMACAAYAQQSFYGTTVSGISLSADADPADQARIPIKPGDVLTPENVRASIQALFDTGQYRSVEVDATATSAGTQLTFNVVRHLFFGTFELVPEELLDRAISTLIRLPVGQRYSDERVDEIVQQTKHVLEDAGYFNALVMPSVTTDTDPHLRKVSLLVTAGPRAHVGQIDMKGGTAAFPEKDLRDAFHISTGDRYNRVEIDHGITAVRKRFLDDSYLNTRVDVAEPEYDAATNTVRLSVTVDPGQRTLVEVINSGPTKISEDDIRPLLPVFEEGAVDEDLLREGRARIVEYLQRKGYFEAVVEPPKVTVSPEGPSKITIEIEAGERHTIQAVRFSGNTLFTDKVLKERIRIRAKSIFGFLNHGIYSKALAAADAQTIQDMYRLAGYEAAFVDPKVEEIDPEHHEIGVTFEIIENMQFKIERLSFVGNDSIPEADLRAAIKIKEGDLYAPSKANDAQTALIRLYYDMGYPDVRIEPSAETNPETRDKLLTYRIVEGPRYRIVQIVVAGNTQTSEKVIKRTSGLKEYTWYDPEKVLDAQQKLYATGLFRHVDIVPLDSETGERRVVLIQVEEAKHILVVPGIGVKEYAGPRALLDVSHNNLFGLNQSLTFRIRAGVHEQQFQTTYRQPRLFNHDDLEGTGALTFDYRNQRTYTSRGLELSLQARKRLSGTRSAMLTASYQTVDLKNLKVSDVVRQSPDLTGIIQIARISASLVSDTRDDVLDPKKGMLSTSTFQVASRSWGSEVNFLSFFNQTTYQKPSGVGTLAASGRLGWKVPYGQTPEIPITERYFAGGSTTLRGFGLDEAGPPGGGQLLTIGNVEYRVPIAPFFIGELGVAVFYDTGNVYERPSDFSLKDFTHSAGTGLRLLTPLGPVRFDIGFNLNPRLELNATGTAFVRERRMRVFFTLGHAF
jgi:outer membrane protein assembly complex protein YaeT